MRQAVWSSVLVVLMLAEPVRADAPAYLPVQGMLTNLADGTPVEGDLMMRFALYTSEIGGTELWNETQWVLVEAGLFTVYLGDTTPLPLSLFRDNTNLYLGVSAGGEAEMARFQIATTGFAAFAQYAGDAARLDGRSASDFAAATHTHAVSDLTGVQSRVTGTCPAGSSIRAVNDDGTVDCETDDDTVTTYTAGPGLTLSGTQFSVSFAGTGTADTAARSDHTQPWSSLTEVPAGFADGTDDTGVSYTAGTGITISGTTISANQTTVEGWARGVCYDTTAELRGALDTVYAPAGHSHAWSTITGMPAGFADGIDNDTLYSWSTLPGIPAGFADGVDNDTLYSAGSGLTLSGTTFSADTSYLQRRVATACAAGSSIRAIDAAGGVTCEPDDVGSGSYTAGAGISISGTTISVATNGIVSSMIANGTVTSDDTALTALTAQGSISLVAGDNYFYGPSYTPSVNQTAVVISLVGISASGTGWGDYVIWFRTAARVGGTNQMDSNFGFYLPSATGGNQWRTMTRSHTWNLTAGTTYQFGCFLGSVPSTAAGSWAYCHTTVIIL